METVEVVIKLPEKTYRKILSNEYDYGDMNVIIQAGIPLPKGHGRLIDVDAATKDVNAFMRAFAMYTDNMGKYNIVCAAPTVIESDKDGDADG